MFISEIPTTDPLFSSDFDYILDVFHVMKSLEGTRKKLREQIEIEN